METDLYKNHEKPLQINVRKFIENYVYVVDKNQKDVIFKLKPEQEQIYNDIKKKMKNNESFSGIVLKARQLGISTFSVVLLLALAITTRNFNGMLITHKEDISQELFSRLKHALYLIPEELRPSILKCNDGELIFDNKNGTGLNSKIKIRVASENSTGLGRGETLNFLHISEYPQWKLKNKEKELGSILNALTPCSIFINEATARGYDDFRTRYYLAALGEISTIAYFFPWFNEPTCRKPYLGFELTKEEEELKRRFNLDNEQIAFRRITINETYAGDVNMFHQEFPSTPEEAFLSSGDCVYNLNSIQKRLEDIYEKNIQALDIGYFKFDMGFDSDTRKRTISNIKWVSDRKNGYIKLFKDVKKRNPYVIGVDPSGEGSDYSAEVVLDNITSEQVATLHKQNISDYDLQTQTYCLAYYYNKALIIPETNYSVGLVSALKEFDANLYISQDDGDSMEEGYKKKYGFRTTPRTRPNLIALSKEFINNACRFINDIEILNEAQNFVRIYKITSEKTTIKEQANVGSHDDLLFALMLALFGRESGQQEFTMLEEEYEDEEYIPTEFDFIFGKYHPKRNNKGGYIYYD